MHGPHSFFVTGTDTGVGKTVVAAALLALLRRDGVDAVPMKPVQTGCRRRRAGLDAPDLEFCLAAARVKASDAERALMCPYRFAPACSPHLAARLAKASISIPRIVTCLRRLRERHDAVVVEGAGGILVPLNARLTMLDLMRRLGLPIALVARPGLGTLNHTLLSLGAIREAGLQVAGVVICRTTRGRPGAIERDNIRTLRRLARAPIWGVLPFHPTLAAGRPPRNLAAWAGRHLDPGMQE